MGRLFEELKRRNVFRVAVAYVVASWLILQVADIVLQGIEAPAWVMKVFMLVLALGFPFTILFSWAYELTPEGLKKEKDVDRTASITPETGRKLNIITIGMLVAVVGILVIERTMLEPVSAPVPEVTAPEAPEASIAVLAFEDLSPEGDQEYFADGLSEELLNVLAKVGDLQVAGRTSSFAFKGTNRDLREIGQLLNVAHILEGSVRKSGNRIRVTAQLIKADDGYHLFSETYDRDLEDIFAVQDEIAAKISQELLTEIIGTEALATKATDTEAYDLFLMARQRIHTRDIFNMREANSMLDRALEIDPLFAPAHAQKALVMHLMSDALGAYGDIPFSEALPISHHHLKKALAIDPNLAEAHAVMGLILDSENRIDEAIVSLERARELNPTDSNAGNWLSTSLSAIGRRDDSRRVLEEVVERDPTYGAAFNNLIGSYLRTSQYDKGEALVDRVEAIVGDNRDVHMARGMMATMRGQAAEAARHMRQVLDLNPNSTVAQMWYGFALFGLADYETLSEVGLIEHRILAFAEMGHMERALEELERFDPSIAFIPRALGEIGTALIGNGEMETFLNYVEENFGTVEELLAEHPVSQSWDTGYVTDLAWAYRQIGDEETVAMLIDVSAAEVAAHTDETRKNWVYLLTVARHAAMTGDDELAIRKLQEAVDNGMILLVEVDAPLYAHLRDDERFQALRAEIVRKVDEQRAILGLPPYRPIESTEERPTFVN